MVKYELSSRRRIGDFKKEMKKYFNLKSIVHRQSLDIKGIKKKSRVKTKFDFFQKYVIGCDVEIFEHIGNKKGWHARGCFRREPDQDVVQVGAQRHRRFSLILGVAVLLHPSRHYGCAESLYRLAKAHREKERPEHVPLLHTQCGLQALPPATCALVKEAGRPPQEGLGEREECRGGFG